MVNGGGDGAASEPIDGHVGVHSLEERIAVLEAISAVSLFLHL